MTSPDLTPSLRLRRVLQVASFVLLTFSVSQIATAQGLDSRPVARLMGEVIKEPTLARPRTVNSAILISSESNAVALTLDAATDFERNAFAKTNEARVANGLPELAWDGELSLFARAHSEEMALRGYFDHETPEGLRLKERARAMGIQRFKVIAENIAYNKGYSDPGSFAVERWMNSPGHRANILYVGFQSAGIGSYVASDGSVYLTQVFINR